MSQADAHPDLAQMMDAAVAGGVFPGGALLVSVRGRRVHVSSHGSRSLEPPGRSVDAATCFDLASLTKVLATAPLVLLSIQRGRLSLDAPVRDLLQGYVGGGRDAITVRMLLDHSSGLPSWRPYYEQVASDAGGAWLATAAGRDAVRRMAATEVPEVQPGSRSLYSDLGFILLDWILDSTRSSASSSSRCWRPTARSTATRATPAPTASSRMRTLLCRAISAQTSELLQAQLRQPLTLDPLPVQRSEANMTIPRASGPMSLGMYELTPLFVSQGVAFSLDALAGGMDTGAGQGTVALLGDKAAARASLFRYDTNGFRDNNDLTRSLGNAFFQVAPRSDLSAQLEIRTGRA